MKKMVVMSELLKNVEDPVLKNQIRSMMNKGENIPCEIAYKVWLSAVNNISQWGCEKTLHVILRGSALSGKDTQGQKIFDGLDMTILKDNNISVIIHNGILREQPQTVLMLDMLKYNPINEIISIEIDVPAHICYQRAKKRAEDQGRIDDLDENAIWKRINRYHDVAHLIDREVKSRNVRRFLVKNPGHLTADEMYNELLGQVNVLNQLTLPEHRHSLKSYGHVPRYSENRVDWMRCSQKKIATN